MPKHFFRDDRVSRGHTPIRGGSAPAGDRDQQQLSSETAAASHWQKTTALLGGPKTLGKVKSALEAHDKIKRGLPAGALRHLLSHLVVINQGASLAVLGISLRTLQRQKGMLAKPLSADQSARTWKFADVLAKATEVFGSQKDAEQWLEQPAIGLEQRRPIDLLKTPAGTKLVETFLERIDYGVYT
jgi:putative toxin-antitoxin system antitoxin component (TIGR02293 family)